MGWDDCFCLEGWRISLLKASLLKAISFEGNLVWRYIWEASFHTIFRFFCVWGGEWSESATFPFFSKASRDSMSFEKGMELCRYHQTIKCICSRLPGQEAKLQCGHHWMWCPNSPFRIDQRVPASKKWKLKGLVMIGELERYWYQITKCRYGTDDSSWLLLDFLFPSSRCFRIQNRNSKRYCQVIRVHCLNGWRPLLWLGPDTMKYDLFLELFLFVKRTFQHLPTGFLDEGNLIRNNRFLDFWVTSFI